MTPDDPKPLPPDLLALLAAEKGAVFAPVDAKARVLGRIGGATGAVGPGGGGASGGPAAQGPGPRPSGRALPSPSLTTLLAFVVGVGVGGAAMHAWTGPPSSAPAADAPRAVPIDRRPDPGEPGPPWHVVEAPPAAPASSASVAPVPEPAAHPIAEAPTASVASVASADDLAAERSLLDAARTALARGNGPDALAAVARHEERYPSGALAEEREAMAIQALLLVKRFDDGRARGARFHRRYPRSVLMPAIDAALASIP
jgi:hypothetical protein